MRCLLATIGITVAGSLVAVAGCNAGSDLDAFDFGSSRKADDVVDSDGVTPAAAVGVNATCTDGATVEKFADPSTLPPCTPACLGAHCVPSDKIPAGSRSAFAACTGGFCIPDALIRSGGGKPASCRSLGDGAGVCLSICIPHVGEKEDVLPRATCGNTERCVPCISPIDNTSTGACSIGIAPVAAPPKTCAKPDGGVKTPGAVNAPSTSSSGSSAPQKPSAPRCPHVGAPVIDPKTLPGCGSVGGAHCLPATLVPAGMSGRLAACTGGSCVPDKLIAAGGNLIPATCTSIGGGEGRCQSLNLPEVAAQADLPVASCDADERCIPCFSPLDGSDTGACRTSCDPGPRGAPVVFRPCCEEDGALQGKCVPTASIPPQLTSHLDDEGCFAGELCVPAEHLQPGFVPRSCRASTFFTGSYSGVCLSDCFDTDFFDDLGTSQGDCDDVHTCVPCSPGIPGCQ